jgi:hypothetical protein
MERAGDEANGSAQRSAHSVFGASQVGAPCGGGGAARGEQSVALPVSPPKQQQPCSYRNRSLVAKHAQRAPMRRILM